MNVVFLSVIIEKTGYESWQTESKLNILTKVAAVYVGSYLPFFTNSKLMNECEVFIARVQQTPPLSLFLWGGGRLYTG